MHSTWTILMGVWLSGCAFVTQSDKEDKICTVFLFFKATKLNLRHDS